MRNLFVILCVSFFISCSTKKFDLTTDRGTIQEADSLRERGFYEEARAQYLRIKTEFPQSPLQVEASLKTALSYYEEESYTASATAYSDFIKTYPGSPEIPEALFKLGMSYVHQMPSTPQRDTRPSAQVIDTMTRLMIDHPDNPHRAEATKWINTARNQLAQKVFDIARFYEKKKDWLAASKRYGEVYEQFSDLPLAEEALARQVRCLNRSGEKEKASKIREIFEEKFPKSNFRSMMAP